MIGFKQGGILGMFLFFAAFTAVRAQAQDNNAETNENYIVSLSDGTELVCVPRISAMSVKTSYASFEIPMSKITSLAFDHEKGFVVLKMVNGDQLQGESAVNAIQVHTLIGDVAVPLIHIVEMVSAKELKFRIEEPARRTACINNLRMITSAKQQWSMVYRKRSGDIVDVKGLCDYIKGGTLPVCPSGGTYKVNPIDQEPECTVDEHTLMPSNNKSLRVMHR
jgi:hypothetical protein